MLHQLAARQLCNNLIGGLADEGFGEVLGGLGGHGNGCVRHCWLMLTGVVV